MTEQEITQARDDLAQLDIEQLRCGVMLQLLKIDSLTKERDMLLYEVDAIPDIKAERDSLRVLLNYEYRQKYNKEPHEPFPLAYHEVCVDLAKAKAERDEYQQAADTQAMQYKVVRDTLTARLNVLEAAAKLALEVCLDMRRYGDQRGVAMAIGAEAALRRAGVQ